MYLFIGIISFLLAISLTACSDDGQNKADGSSTNIKRMHLGSGKEDGAVLILAKDLIAANVNPFLNKLPITADAQEDAAANPPGPIGDDGQASQPAVDPFESVALLGISYQPKNSYALISLSNSEAAQMVREGDVVTSSVGAQLKIGKIQQNQVDIRDTSSVSTSRTFALPDIVGFTGTANGSIQDRQRDRHGRSEEENNPVLDATNKFPNETTPIIKLED